MLIVHYLLYLLRNINNVIIVSVAYAYNTAVVSDAVYIILATENPQSISTGVCLRDI